MLASSVAAVVVAGLERLLSALPQMAEQHPPIAPALVSRLARAFAKKKEAYNHDSWYSSDSDRDRRCRPDRDALLSLLDYLADEHEEVRGQGPLTQSGHSSNVERELSHAPLMHAPPRSPLSACLPRWWACWCAASRTTPTASASRTSSHRSSKPSR